MNYQKVYDYLNSLPDEERKLGKYLFYDRETNCYNLVGRLLCKIGVDLKNHKSPFNILWLCSYFEATRWEIYCLLVLSFDSVNEYDRFKKVLNEIRNSR